MGCGNSNSLSVKESNRNLQDQPNNQDEKAIKKEEENQNNINNNNILILPEQINVVKNVKDKQVIPEKAIFRQNENNENTQFIKEKENLEKNNFSNMGIKDNNNANIENKDIMAMNKEQNFNTTEKQENSKEKFDKFEKNDNCENTNFNQNMTNIQNQNNNFQKPKNINKPLFNFNFKESKVNYNPGYDGNVKINRQVIINNNTRKEIIVNNKREVIINNNREVIINNNKSNIKHIFKQNNNNFNFNNNYNLNNINKINNKMNKIQNLLDPFGIDLPIDINNMINIGNNNINFDINQNNNDINFSYNEDHEPYEEDINSLNENDNHSFYDEEYSKLKEEERKKREEEERIKREQDEERKKREEEERKKREEEERKKREEEKRKIEEEKKLRKEKQEKTKKLIEDNKDNQEKVLKKETERINKEIQEKTKSFEEKIKKLLIENENNLKLQEEKRKAEDEKEGRWKKYEKVGGEYRSKKEIREQFLPLLKYKDVKDEFQVKPKTRSPYNSGKLSEEYLKIPLKMLNFARFMVGIPNDVINDSSYEKLAQDASLLMKVNNKLAHTGQPKPKNMDKKLYDSGAKGCKSCNIFWGISNLYDGVEGWIVDDGNFTTIGHRRWILYPPMKKTGFGKVDDYAAMYCFDNNFGETPYKNIPWPCRNMTLEFANTSHWTLSTGKQLPYDIIVTLTNRRTGKIQTFSNKNKNKFCISNDNFGLEGCVIFEGPLVEDEESYRVDINGKDIAISYDVDFFNAICKHNLELLESIEPSCIKAGKKFYFCKKCCDYKKEEEINMISHKEILLDEISPTCIEEGKQIFKCEFCSQIIEKKLDKIPHNYNCKLISENTGEANGICKYCEKQAKFIAPTYYNVFWGVNNSNGYSSYNSSCPYKNKLNSTLNCWITNINGDYEYKKIVLEISNPKLVEVNDKNEYKDLLLKGVGKVDIIIYPKYNPNLKSEFQISIE